MDSADDVFSLVSPKTRNSLFKPEHASFPEKGSCQQLV